MRSFAHRLRVASGALIILVPFVLCVLLYLPTLAGGLLSDDYSVLGALAGWSRDGELIAALARKFWSGLDAPNHYYRPLAMVSFALNFATSGAAPLSWRLTSLAIHLASGGLVAVIVARFFADAPPWLRTLAS